VATRPGGAAGAIVTDEQDRTRGGGDNARLNEGGGGVNHPSTPGLAVLC
jgi:hypothetical protein